MLGFRVTGWGVRARVRISLLGLGDTLGFRVMVDLLGSEIMLGLRLGLGLGPGSRCPGSK